MKAELKFKFSWWALCHMVAFAILIVCLIPSSGKIPTYEHLDKFFHFIGHALLAFCYTQLWNKQKLNGLFLTLLFYGFLIEVLQLITGWRTFDLWDVFANGMGTLYGILFAISLGKDFFKTLENLKS
jgi:glycopeptide antibiotics resistance protein